MKRAAAQVGGAAIVVAVAGYVAQFLAARFLGPADYSRFAVFWSVLFVVVSLLGGIAQEVIRVSRLAKLRLDAGANPVAAESHHPRIAVVAVSMGAATSVALILTGLLWAPPVLGDDWGVALALLALASVLVGAGVTAGGIVAGLARWRTYALLVTFEGLSRLILFVIAALVSPTIVGFSVAAVLAFVPSPAIALLWSSLRRQTLAMRFDTGPGESMTRILRAMVASGLSGVLIIGTAALLSAASAVSPRGSNAASLGVLILLVTLTRAPLMVPLTSFQNAVVARFTGLDRQDRRRWVLRGTGAIVLASAALSGLAALLGPPLLPVVFGDAYQAGPAIVAALTAATAGLAIITLTGVAAITADRHNLYVLGWGAAIAVTLLLLFFLPAPFEWVTVAALGAGPLVGAAVHLRALAEPAPRGSGSDAP
jgi:O-antigen/teichoic acid export membrane protein